MSRLSRPSFASAVALLSVLAVACNPEVTSDPAAPSSVDRPLLIGGTTPGDGLPNFEAIEVCKYGSSADINVDLTYPSGPSNATHSLADGECLVVGNFDGGNTADIAIQEANLPAGIQFDSLRYTVIRRRPVTTDPVVVSTTNSFTFTGADNHVGILVEFFNSVTPPPPGGGEGCTPGYWKQPHHFDSWVGYTQNQLFSSVFENAYPGKTLLQVLGANGNTAGEALGRHTVAALLNAASGSGVSYDLTTAEVNTSFNAVFPGSKNSYNALKDQFEAFNQQGCPLN